MLEYRIIELFFLVQQSSFYGYTSMLPSRYTQAVMAGESLAGFWVSINRLVTKLLINDERGNTSIFFILSITTILMCRLLYRLVRKTEFVQFYIHLCQERNKITLEPTEDIGLMDPLEQVDSSKGQYGILKLQTSPLAVDSGGDPNGAQYSAFSFSNPVYEPNGPSGNPLSGTGPKYKVEDVVVMRGFSRNQSSKPWSGIKSKFYLLFLLFLINQLIETVLGGLLARLEVAKLIFPYMASIGVAYFVTLCLYPGIVSEIISCKFESWMPVILMATFNGADLLGKILASISYEWTRTQLVYFSIARILLIPLFLLCAIPRHAPILSSEIYPLLFSWLLGLTNGIVGSVPMIQAPSKVPEEHRELAGNIMTLSYTTGLTLGSLLAYILDAFLGHPVTTKEICVNLLTATVPTTFISNNMTTDILASSIKHTTLPTIKNISKISNMLMTTTATKMATHLTTSLMTNKTAILLGNALNTTSTTTVPIIFTNVTSTISNAIIQH